MTWARGKILVLFMLIHFAAASFAQDVKDRDLLKVAVPNADASVNPTHVPHGYAVIIGVSRYERSDIAPLQFPESDADAVYRTLISPTAGAFPAENVHRLIGRDATLANIRREIEQWLPSVAQPEDRVVVYFAGHGVVSQGRGYLAAWDIDLNRILDTAYPMQTLGSVLANRVRARWKALFADACHSGKLNAETTDEGVAEQLDATATQYLSFSATLGRQRSYEDPSLSTGFGLFSYFLVQGLIGNADNNPCDGLITADELIEYVRFNVREYASQHGMMQTPHAGSDYDPAMPLGVSRVCGATLAANPISGTLVIDSSYDALQIFVDDRLVGTVNKGIPLTIPGLALGLHEIKAAKEGYKPEVRQVTVIPGQSASVSIRLLFESRIKKPALDLNEAGESLLQRSRGSLNFANEFRGVRSQDRSDLEKARDYFARALKEDPSFSLAAYNLGVVNGDLGDDAGSKTAYQRAVQADPTDVRSRTAYAESLMSAGDVDEAIRQLTEALRFSPHNPEVQAKLAGAYYMKTDWRDCITAAEEAISLDFRSYIAHFRRADCTRELANEAPAGAQKQALFSAARDDYQTFISITNYSNSLLRRIAFYMPLGTTRTHADRKDAYESWREAGYLGLCIADKNLGNLLRARDYCNRAVGYAPNDAIAHFFLGNVNRDLFNATKGCEYIPLARADYQKVVELNPNLAEAKNARQYLAQIDQLHDALVRRGCKDL